MSAAPIDVPVTATNPVTAALVPLIEVDGEPRSMLTCAEAARLLGRDATTVRSWCAAGKIAARKIGSMWWVPAAALGGVES